MSLPCWLKWGFSLIAGPALGVGAFLVFCAAVFGVAFLLWTSWSSAAKAVIPNAERRRKVADTLFGSDLELGILLKFFILAVVSGFVYILGAVFLQVYYGCDECLPAFMQASCKAAATAAAQNQRDHNEFVRLCEMHPEWCESDVAPDTGATAP